MTRITQTINGILLLDKSLKITSNGALQMVKRLFSAKKAGHTGSLDPLATGMLPLCFGEATKFSQFLLESDKWYLVQVKLGVKTTTGDAEGEIIERNAVTHITQEQIEKVLSTFQGWIHQIPPMYSAIKYKGQPLYKLARKGVEVERQPREVCIHRIVFKDLEEDTFTMQVHCSKGTYIRVLAEDIGNQLGCGAYVSGLRRLAVSPYQAEKMFTLDALDAIHKEFGWEGLQRCLLPTESSVQHLPSVNLSVSAIFYMKAGQPVMVPNAPREGYVKIFSNDMRFLGVGEILEDGRVAPRRLVAG